MNPRDYARLLKDMTLFGFIDPLTVRPHPEVPGMFQIIDGENRWRAARDLQLRVPYMDIGPVDDATAKKLTIALNELRGQYDPKEMGDLLNDLLSQETPEQLLEQLPFTEDTLAGLVGLKGFDFKGLDKPVTPGTTEKGTRWVERTFRLSAEANEVLTDAIRKVRDGQENDISEAQALEFIAAEFLSGS